MTPGFENTADYAVLTGVTKFGVTDYANSMEPMMTFWMNYVWSAFCLQWVAIAWLMLIGVEKTGHESEAA